MGLIRGYLAEIRPIPMLLVVLTVIFGALLSNSPFSWFIMGIVVLNAFLFIYVAHLNDTYWDVKRGEYEAGYSARWGLGGEIPNAPLLPPKFYLVAMLISGSLGTVIAVWMSLLVGWLYAPLAFLGLGLAMTYSVGIDKIPVLGDVYWELGAISALGTGYYVAKGVLDSYFLIVALPLFIALVGFKMIDALPDIEVDDKENKRTIPVLLWRRGLSKTAIRNLAFIPVYIMYATLLLALPTPLWPAIITSLSLMAFAHIVFYRSDPECRKTIVLGGFAFILLLAWLIIQLSIA